MGPTDGPRQEGSNATLPMFPRHVAHLSPAPMELHNRLHAYLMSGVWHNGMAASTLFLDGSGVWCSIDLAKHTLVSARVQACSPGVLEKDL